MSLRTRYAISARRPIALLGYPTRASFDAVRPHEIMGRRPVALGTDAARTLRYFEISHVTAPHPSARIGTYAQKAEHIASAMKDAA